MDNFNNQNERDDGLDREGARGNSGGQVSTIWIIGLAMLVVGLVVGYLGRGAFGPEARAAKATLTAEAIAAQTQAVAELSAAETRVVANAEVMQMIISKTLHFKGQSDAPVTLIEFSDYK
jgi:hypothetical protein